MFTLANLCDILFQIGIVCFIFSLLIFERKTKLNEVLTDKNNKEKNKQKNIKFEELSQKYFKKIIPKPNTSSYIKRKKILTKLGSENNISVEGLFAKQYFYGAMGALAVIFIGAIPIILSAIQQLVFNSSQQITLFLSPTILIILFFGCSLLLYNLPLMEIKQKRSVKEAKMSKELISTAILVQTMLETGNTPYDILLTVKDIKPIFKPYFEVAINEYYVNFNEAMENLKERVGLRDFDMVVDSFIYSNSTDNKQAADFLNQYIVRLEEIFKINKQKSNRIKPYLLLASSIPPLLSAIIIWFYPWIAKTLSNLNF